MEAKAWPCTQSRGIVVDVGCTADALSLIELHEDGNLVECLIEYQWRPWTTGVSRSRRWIVSRTHSGSAYAASRQGTHSMPTFSVALLYICTTLV